jgi:lysozyme
MKISIKKLFIKTILFLFIIIICVYAFYKYKSISVSNQVSYVSDLNKKVEQEKPIQKIKNIIKEEKEKEKEKEEKDMSEKVLPIYKNKGIDVSHHNGVIDWKKVKADNVNFMFAKATEADDFVDKRAKDNLKNAKAAGLKVGAYHFFTLCMNGKVQAENYISIVKKEEIDMPPVMDLELYMNCGNKNLDKEVKEIKIFLDILEKYYNKKPIIYTTIDTYSVYENKFNILDYPLWVRITDRHIDSDNYTNIFGLPEGKEKEIRKIFQEKALVWQQCDVCKVSGIKGNVDVNFWRE